MGGKTRRTLGSGIARALQDVAVVIARHERRAAVIGGIAVIARGVPRTTRDIDVLVAGQDISVRDLAAELAEAGITPRIADAVAFAEQNEVLLARHTETGVDIDVSRAWIPFELEALESASNESLGGVRTSIALPEDLIIFKAVAWRPHDQQDVERLLALYGSRIDLDRIRRYVTAFGEALEIDRIAALDALIDRIVKR
ncbi:MAG TPA: nucleotidyltransferase [Kofleriaceae bacterium]|jgi:predicted nucleotidyltransferase|nr:nucleotidyltransferase [Kofleriaceae bacterium]